MWLTFPLPFFTLLTKHRKTQYTFPFLLPNYQPNTGKDTNKFSFSKRKKKLSSHFLTSPHFLESNQPRSEVSSSTMKVCHYGLQCKIWTCKQGFQFFGCANYKVCMGCGFFLWVWSHKQITEDWKKLRNCQKSGSSVVFDEDHLCIRIALLCPKVDVSERGERDVYLFLYR